MRSVLSSLLILILTGAPSAAAATFRVHGTATIESRHPAAPAQDYDRLAEVRVQSEGPADGTETMTPDGIAIPPDGITGLDDPSWWCVTSAALHARFEDAVGSPETGSTASWSMDDHQGCHRVDTLEIAPFAPATHFRHEIQYACGGEPDVRVMEGDFYSPNRAL